MTDDDALLLRSRLTIHRQLNPNYAGDLAKSTSKSDEDNGESDKNWERPGNVVAKRNARERTRVHTVNQAFLVLKSHLPSLRSHTKRVSKLKILRAAINYIEALLELLKKDQGNQQLIHNQAKNNIVKQQAMQTQAMADRSLAAPLTYPVNMQTLLGSHSYIYQTHPSQQAPAPQTQLIHPFLLNNYH